MRLPSFFGGLHGPSADERDSFPLHLTVPLFWSQSPYTDSQLSLKPAPTLDRPLTASLAPLSAHFVQLVKTYGRQTIVSLSEVSGKEGLVTNGYREVVGDVGMEGVEWREFDFHHECKGPSNPVPPVLPLDLR